jgi:hypothetical protein
MGAVVGLLPITGIPLPLVPSAARPCASRWPGSAWSVPSPLGTRRRPRRSRRPHAARAAARGGRWPPVRSRTLTGPRPARVRPPVRAHRAPAVGRAGRPHPDAGEARPARRSVHGRRRPRAGHVEPALAAGRRAGCAGLGRVPWTALGTAQGLEARLVPARRLTGLAEIPRVPACSSTHLDLAPAARPARRCRRAYPVAPGHRPRRRGRRLRRLRGAAPYLPPAPQGRPSWSTRPTPAPASRTASARGSPRTSRRPSRKRTGPRRGARHPLRTAVSRLDRAAVRDEARFFGLSEGPCSS